MAYSAQAVANAFIERAQKGEIRNLTPMKLQKLLFYVQSWYLRDHDGTPLMDDHFARWTYGPVIPSLYHDLKSYGARPITSKISTALRKDGDFKIVTPSMMDDDEEAQQYIDLVIETYGELSGPRLSWLTHEPGTAWSMGPTDGGFISRDDMAQHIHPQNRMSESDAETA
ncbi:MAG: Panacea domain-containing protein [Pseudomonadota bacterium]